MYKTLLKQIKISRNICIFRHIRPDGDACFSQFALAQFIKDNFKDKKVEMCGLQEYDLLPYSNMPDYKFIANSLVIVLDTATVNRVDGEDYRFGKYVFKIDHHPNKDAYADTNIVNEKSSSTCELLADIFYSKEFKGFRISHDTCKYLYSGILTDSNCFSTSNTTSNTLMLASKLVEDGKLDITALNNYLFDKELINFKAVSGLRNELKIKDGLGYVIASKELLKKLKMSSDDAKNAINEFGHIKKLKIWAVIAYNAKTGYFDGSIRSNKKYVINDICSKYNGGGHKNACGVKSLSVKQYKQLLKDLKELASK